MYSFPAELLLFSGGWGVWTGEEKTRIRLSLAQFQMKLSAGAELGNSVKTYLPVLCLVLCSL